MLENLPENFFEEYELQPEPIPKTPYEFLLQYGNIDNKDFMSMTWDDIHAIGADWIFTRILERRIPPPMIFKKKVANHGAPPD